ncbi:MAG: hypothetical protein P1V97_26995 [Planctomycetota bacterium]|nr:hypothetical protein [Planctomycetota bacterium]
MFPKTDIQSGWGAAGTKGGASASFFKRYYTPLLRYCRHKFSVSDAMAEDLVSRFVAREFERECEHKNAVFRLYDPERGRFRSYLASAFWRFARDELEKEQRRRGVSLESIEDQREQSAEDFEFCRLVAREFFNNIREKLVAKISDDQEKSCLDLKWPVDSDNEPKSNAEIERTLGLSRSKVRTIVGKIADHFTFVLYQQIYQAGLSASDAKEILGDCCRVLDEEQKIVEASEDR